MPDLTNELAGDQADHALTLLDGRPDLDDALVCRGRGAGGAIEPAGVLLTDIRDELRQAR